jgi:hypothetical protein
MKIGNGGSQMNAKQRWIVLVILYSLFLLIGLAGIGAALGLFPKADEGFKTFAVGIFFVDVTAAAVAVFKTVMSTPKTGEHRVFVNLLFEGKTPSEVALASCRYEVRNGDNVLKRKGEAAVLRGPGGWQCSFPMVMGEVLFGYARLELIEHNNTIWQVRNFPLNNVTMQAEKVA